MDNKVIAFKNKIRIIKRKLAEFVSLAAKFGVFEGLVIYFKFQSKSILELRLKSLKHPIYMQPKTIDRASFQEIFINEEYDIIYPDFGRKEITIFDAGANIGLASSFFKNKFPSSRIIALEPDEENYKWLKKNTDSYDGITSIQCGIWNKDAFLLVKLEEGRSTRSFMVEEVSSESEETVRGYSVDSLMEKYNVEVIDIFKIDIEGSEKELFSENYEFWLPRTKCLIVETHDRMKSGCSEAVLDAVKKYDFEMFESGENTVFLNKRKV